MEAILLHTKRNKQQAGQGRKCCTLSMSTNLKTHSSIPSNSPEHEAEGDRYGARL